MPDYRRSLRGRRQSWFGLKRHVKRALSLPGIHGLMRVVAPRVPTVRVGRLPAPARLHEVVGHAGDATYVMLRPDRCEIAKELYWGRGRRPDPRDALALDVVVALTGRADLFLDIGAYTGVFTMATTAAHPALRAQAFEIVPAVASVLRDNVRRNQVADRVTVHQRGVGDPAATMAVPTGEGGSALPSFYSSAMQFEGGTEVSFTALDDLADDPGGPVVIKIDVEGAEDEVLAHGQVFLARHGPDMLCEVLPGVADGPELERLLQPHGYHHYLVRGSDLVGREHLQPDERYRDWLLTRRSREELAELGIPVAAG